MYRQVNERIEDLNDMFGEMSGEFFVVASVATPYVWSRSLCRGRHTSGRGRIQLSSSSGPGTRQLPWRTCRDGSRIRGRREVRRQTRAAGPGNRPAGLTVSSSARVSALGMTGFRGRALSAATPRSAPTDGTPFTTNPIRVDTPRGRGRGRAERRGACSSTGPVEDLS